MPNRDGKAGKPAAFLLRKRPGELAARLDSNLWPSAPEPVGRNTIPPSTRHSATSRPPALTRGAASACHATKPAHAPQQPDLVARGRPSHERLSRGLRARCRLDDCRDSETCSERLAAPPGGASRFTEDCVLPPARPASARLAFSPQALGSDPGGPTRRGSGRSPNIRPYRPGAFSVLLKRASGRKGGFGLGDALSSGSA